jgi:precorrin-2 dehydrogenase/sirohydrochlorin ferrochelatase
MKTYPVCLIGLESRSVVVIGGGEVATRKVAGLLEAGAQVTVISPKVTDELAHLAQAGQVQVMLRPYRQGDLQGVFLAVAATDDAPVNEAVWQEARACGCLVNVVDDPARSNFITPAVIQRGEIKIAITTGGASPALARRLREKLERDFGPEYGSLAELMAELRPQLLGNFPAGAARLQAALHLVDSELLDVIRQQGLQQARLVAQELLSELARRHLE